MCSLCSFLRICNHTEVARLGTETKTQTCAYWLYLPTISCTHVLMLWYSTNWTEAKHLITLCLCLCVCSLWRVLVWIKDPSTWPGHRWVGTSQGCMLPFTLLTCPVLPWFAQQVNKQTSDLHDVSLLPSTIQTWCCFISPLHPPPPPPLCPPGLIYPQESEFITNLREMEKSQEIGQIALIPFTLEELEKMLKLCHFKPLKLHRQVRSSCDTACEVSLVFTSPWTASYVIETTDQY